MAKGKTPGKGGARGGTAKGDGAKGGSAAKRPERSAESPPAKVEAVADAAAKFEAPSGPTATSSAPAEPAAPSPALMGRPRAAAIGDPIAAFERRWTWLETRLITLVLVWQLASLVTWVALGGLAAAPNADSSAGTVFRSVLGAVVLAGAAWAVLRDAPLAKRRGATIAALVVGLALGPAWRGVGVAYFDNVKGWLQEGSTLTLLGGLRGLATRLTLWLALLGGSLATAAGKHIHIDLVFRFLPKRARVPAAIVNYLAAAVVCVAGAWGFFDFNAIQSYDAKADDSAGAKVAVTLHEMGDHAFLTRKQIGLDLRSLPHVLAGEHYDGWMSGGAWNEWVKGAGFESKWRPEQVATLPVGDGAGVHTPLVVSPDGKATRGMLIEDLNLVFPFGLLAIALRFVLRALLTATGHVPADPDEAVKEDLSELGHAGEGPDGDARAEGGA
jgi:hypothetical protein